MAFENLEIIIDVLVDNDDLIELAAQLEEIDAQIEDLDGTQINLDAHVGRLEGRRRLKNQIERLEREGPVIPVDLSRIEEEVGQVQTAIEGLESQDVEIPVNLNVDESDLAVVTAMRQGEGLSFGGDGGDSDAFEALQKIARGDFDGLQITGGDDRTSLGAGIARSADDIAEGMFGFMDFDTDEWADTFESMEEIGDVFNLRMQDIHNLFARLIPLLLVFIGAIPAAITAIYALAGAALAAASALFAIGAIGALGLAIERAGVGNIGEGFSSIIDEIRNDFLDAFVPLAKNLSGIFEDAIDGLDRLFSKIAARGDVLIDFTEQARAFGGFILNNLPRMIGNVGRLAQAAAPIFAQFGKMLDGVSIIRMLGGVLADVLPSFMALATAIGRIIPDVIQLSIGFMRVAAMIVQLLDALFFVITFFGMFGEEVGMAIAALLALTTVVALFGSLIMSVATANMVAMLNSLAGFIVALYQSAAAAITLSGAVGTLAASILTLIAVTGIGLAVVGVLALLGSALGAIASKFADTSTNIDKATKSLRSFHRAASKIRGNENPFAFGEGGQIQTRQRPNGTTIVINGSVNKDETKEQVHNYMSGPLSKGY